MGRLVAVGVTDGEKVADGVWVADGVKVAGGVKVADGVGVRLGVSVAVALAVVVGVAERRGGFEMAAAGTDGSGIGVQVALGWGLAVGLGGGVSLGRDVLVGDAAVEVTKETVGAVVALLRQPASMLTTTASSRIAATTRGLRFLLPRWPYPEEGWTLFTLQVLLLVTALGGHPGPGRHPGRNRSGL